MSPWIKAARLRTLPLALSGILLGAALSYLNNHFKWEVLLPALLTATLLQVLSNYANDYGDFVKGTDARAGRQDRALAAGEISPRQMKQAMVIVSVAALGSGIVLLNNALSLNTTFLLYLLLGLGAITAALKYTVGKGAYAYQGLGEVFVFIFFGLVAVCGTHFLMCGQVLPRVWLAGAGMGLLSSAVLNVNNMRDISTDREAGKRTVAMRLGIKGALFLHRFLIATGFLFVFASFLSELGGLQIRPNLTETLLLLLAYAPVILLLTGHMSALRDLAAAGVPETHEGRLPWNRQLKNLSLSSLLLVVMYWICCLLFV